MDVSIHLRDKDGGIRSIGYYAFDDQEYENLKDDWLDYLKGGNVKGGAYECCQIGGATNSAAPATAGEPCRTHKVVLLRFDDVVYIG